MAKSFTLQRIVEFSETDMAGLVHFTNFFRYVEAAEAALFEEIGWPLVHVDEQGSRGWPRVRASAKFHHPLHFRDRIQVSLGIKTLHPKAIDWKAAIHKNLSPGEPVKAASLNMTTFHVQRPRTGLEMAPLSLPPELIERLEPYAEEILV